MIENISTLISKLGLKNAEISEKDNKALFRAYESYSFSPDATKTFVFPILMSKVITARDQEFNMNVFLTAVFNGDKFTIGFIPMKSIKKNFYHPTYDGSRPKDQFSLLTLSKSDQMTGWSTIVCKLPVVKKSKLIPGIVPTFQETLKRDKIVCLRLAQGEDARIITENPDIAPPTNPVWMNLDERQTYTASPCTSAEASQYKEIFKELYTQYEASMSEEYKANLKLEAPHLF